MSCSSCWLGWLRNRQARGNQAGFEVRYPVRLTAILEHFSSGLSWQLG
jgi:hypothetical protein